MSDRLLTTRDLQDLLHLDRVTIYKMVREGRLPALRVGGQWRFPAADVESWLRGHAPAATPGASSVMLPALSLPLPPLPGLVELIPSQTLQDIQNQFAGILGIAAFITDPLGRPLLRCSRCSAFCQLIHAREAGMAACQASWAQIASTGSGGAAIYTCHAGIRYAAAPLVVLERPLGMVIAGQFHTARPAPVAGRAAALAVADRLELDGEALALARTALEVISEERALQITGLLTSIAGALSGVGYQALHLRQVLGQIAEVSRSVSPAERL